jgi:serine/threonine protein kinase
MGDLLHNRFRVIRKCGSGGTGDVFQAEDTRLKRIVALKRARGGPEQERLKRSHRLLREAEYLARIDHPNVVAIHDCIETETSVTIVMELVKGATFKELFRKQAIPQPELLAYLDQLASALAAVHEAGVIHRDVNPKNVLVSSNGIVKLMDFGLAGSADLEEHRAGGTIGYMAPESIRKGGKIGVGVDIYALGFLSYQSLLGDPDFQRLYGTTSPIEWARWLLSREKFKTLAELDKPVAPALSAIVEKMLEKDPKERYQKVSDVQRDLDRLAGRVTPSNEVGPSLVAGVRWLLPSIRARQGGK